MTQMALVMRPERVRLLCNACAYDPAKEMELRSWLAFLTDDRPYDA